MFCIRPIFAKCLSINLVYLFFFFCFIFVFFFRQFPCLLSYVISLFREWMNVRTGRREAAESDLAKPRKNCNSCWRCYPAKFLFFLAWHTFGQTAGQYLRSDAKALQDAQNATKCCRQLDFPAQRVGQSRDVLKLAPHDKCSVIKISVIFICGQEKWQRIKLIVIFIIAMWRNSINHRSILIKCSIINCLTEIAKMYMSELNKQKTRIYQIILI